MSARRRVVNMRLFAFFLITTTNILILLNSLPVARCATPLFAGRQLDDRQQTGAHSSQEQSAAYFWPSAAYLAHRAPSEARTVDSSESPVAAGHNDLAADEQPKVIRKKAPQQQQQQQQSSGAQTHETSLYNEREYEHRARGATYHHSLAREQQPPAGAAQEGARLLSDKVFGPDARHAEREANPLIEPPESERSRHQRRAHRHKHHKAAHFRRHFHRRKAHRSAPPLRGELPTESLQPEAAGWLCERHCNSTLYQDQQATSASEPICGSDGQLYASLCHLERQSCLEQSDLSERPAVYCQRSGPDSSLRKSWPASDEDKVRIVELKRRCNNFELEQMKLLLLEQFNGDLSSMFKHFDSNGDKLIEAHELWPRRSDDSTESLYAQIWDDHSSSCAHPLESADELERPARRKCWFLLDFAFEPTFANNSCSLSHLMLFDLKHPNHFFSYETFRKALLSPKLHALTLAANDDQGELSRPPVRRVTSVSLRLGDSLTLNCLHHANLSLNQAAEGEKEREKENLSALEDQLIEEDAIEDDDGEGQLGAAGKCSWIRYNLNLASVRDAHISVEERRFTKENGKKALRDLVLRIKDAQLYLSGQFKCVCHMRKFANSFEHLYKIQVLAEPRVEVKPRFQRTLARSRVSFECHYDYIDTSLTRLDSDGANFERKRWGQDFETSRESPLNDNKRGANLSAKEEGQFGLKVAWLKDNKRLLANDDKPQMDNKEPASTQEAKPEMEKDWRLKSDHTSWAPSPLPATDDSFYSPDNNNDNNNNNVESWQDEKAPKEGDALDSARPNWATRASLTMASSRLTLESARREDSGHYACSVQAPLEDKSTLFDGAQQKLEPASRRTMRPESSSFGELLVEDGEPLEAERREAEGRNLWMFHENGISIYKFQNDGGQEMELLREITGHSSVGAEVDGNWNQLTLCGGLNPEQVVICEWSDNAVHIDLGASNSSSARKYVYVGQPNLNRVIVLDGDQFEIVAIINTEPQPRKLHLYKPNKLHLSKWVRRRLSPAASARWLAAIGTYAHALNTAPSSKLYSQVEPSSVNGAERGGDSEASSRLAAWQQQRDRRRRRGAPLRRFARTLPNQLPSSLMQYDIWLLCYGQPLVVDPAGDESAEQRLEDSGPTSPAAGNNTLRSDSKRESEAGEKSRPSVLPFTPRLSGAPGAFVWPSWPANKESKLRNRKSVHIIQSTFFPRPPTRRHSHAEAADIEDEQLAWSSNSIDEPNRRKTNQSVVAQFKRSTVITTHHVFVNLNKLTAKSSSTYGAAKKRQFNHMYDGTRKFDLIQDLHVPSRPYSMEANKNYRLHHAYVTHYDEQRLFRVSMDEYRYDQEIDLQNCDPISLLTTAQGLLVVQCRAPITHNLIGQLVLDELTSSRIEFNANIRAQESYISPDHRYLISIFNNLSAATAKASSSSAWAADSKVNKSRSQQEEEENLRGGGDEKQSIIYVQSIGVSGLKLEYEIKTSSLELSQCSFVWKDGYYAAIFVSTNRRDQQSELLSLRLADGRLELMARVQGLISAGHSRHKDQLVVSGELKLAALTTTMGTFLVDLEDNRVCQSLRHHQSRPTLTWV